MDSHHIERTVGICGGRPRIAGSRIRVQDIVVWHEALGLSPEEIVAQHPQLSLANVHAALAYYYDHRDEIRRDMEEGRALAEALEQATPSKLMRAMTRHDDGLDPLPPG